MKDVLDRLPISQKVRVEKFWYEFGLKEKPRLFEDGEYSWNLTEIRF